MDQYFFGAHMEDDLQTRARRGPNLSKLVSDALREGRDPSTLSVEVSQVPLRRVKTRKGEILVPWYQAQTSFVVF